MKTVTSPVAKYPGTVDLPDFYLFDRAIPWDDAQETVLNAKGLRKFEELAKAIYPMIDGWHIDNLPADPAQWPIHPRSPFYGFIQWLFSEVSAVYYGVDESPLSDGASSDGSTVTETDPQS